jgi:hypothetical protein
MMRFQFPNFRETICMERPSIPAWACMGGIFSGPHSSALPFGRLLGAMARRTPFQLSHKLNFALRVEEKYAAGLVVAVSCQFCRYVGREAAVGEKHKRARSSNMLVFQIPPFRSEQ